MYCANEVSGLQPRTKEVQPKINNLKVTFVETVNQAIKLGQIVVPTKSESTKIVFDRNKMWNVKDVKWSDEEESLNSFIKRIEKLLKQGGEK